MIWAKTIHIAAIAIWSAGLIGLPSLYLMRAGAPDEHMLHRLQASVRFIYVSVLSPAAFVAVGSGTALIFLRSTFETWFTLKLFLVGLMVILHVFTGLVIIRLFDKGQTYPLARFVRATLLTGILVSLILLVVLSKPELPDPLPEAFRQPGALQGLLRDLNPFQR